MKAILLDGSLISNAASEQINKAVVQNLKLLGYDVEDVPLREKTIGNCAGDFFCWIRTPGICNVKDDNLAIAESIINSDLMVYITPITFGGYSSTLKKAVDHQLQNISPYFSVINGETHHEKRYEKYPDVVVFGYTEVNNPVSETVFKNLVHRNSINFFAENATCEVINTQQSDDQIFQTIKTCLANIQSGFSVLPLPKLNNLEDQFSPVEVKRAVLLIGSPRTGKSTSNSLGQYLYNILDKNHIQSETIYLHTIMRSPEKIEAMLEALDSADLITLAFPLYIDSLPAPVIKALEIIAANRKGNKNSNRQLFTAIVNCGFPEASHNTTALAICEVFANQTGFIWGGGLSLGGGGMVGGTPLSQMDGRAVPIKKSLEMAADALIHGNAIPQQAKILMSKPVIPAWMYRMIGNFGWKQGAKKYDSQKLLKRRAYQIP